MYADNEYKFVAVLNEKIALPRLLNAMGHMTAGLVARQNGHLDSSWLCYEDGDGGIHPAISRHPFIILSAKNSNQIRTLRQAALQHGVAYNDFTDTMLGASAEDQLARTAGTREQDLEYFGICLFGRAEELHPLTRRFSLFRG